MNEEIKIEGDLDIKEALKEFEEKTKAEYAPSPVIPKTPDAPRMVLWVMKLSGGAIKEQKHAEYILLGVAVLMFAVSIYFFFG